MGAVNQSEREWTAELIGDAAAGVGVRGSIPGDLVETGLGSDLDAEQSDLLRRGGLDSPATGAHGFLTIVEDGRIDVESGRQDLGMAVASHLTGEGGQQADRLGGRQPFDRELNLRETIGQQRGGRRGEGAAGLNQRVINRSVQQGSPDVARGRCRLTGVQADAGDRARRRDPIRFQLLTAAAHPALEVLDVDDDTTKVARIASGTREMPLAGVRDRRVCLHVAEARGTPDRVFAGDVHALIKEPVGGAHCNAFVNGQVVVPITAVGDKLRSRCEEVLLGTHVTVVINVHIHVEAVVREDGVCPAGRGCRFKGIAERGEGVSIGGAECGDAVARGARQVERRSECAGQVGLVREPLRETTKVGAHARLGLLKGLLDRKSVGVYLSEAIVGEALAGEYRLHTDEEVAKMPDN